MKQSVKQFLTSIFTAIYTWLRSAWLWLTDWFEHGDLVPLLVIVSAVHYAAVLRGKDDAAVAISIGMLVDLGHFRTIRAAFRYPGAKAKRRRKLSEGARWYHVVCYYLERPFRKVNAQLAARWLIAAVMTAISFAYHYQYYEGELLFAAPIPFLIAALAWLQRVDANVGAKRAAGNAKKSEPPVTFRYNCEEHAYRTNNQRAWAGHMRKHK